MGMAWRVEFHPVFEQEFDKLAPDVQEKLFAHANMLSMFGPSRPSTSRHAQGIQACQHEGDAFHRS